MKHLGKTTLMLLATVLLLAAQSGLVSSLVAAPVAKRYCCGDRECPTKCCVEKQQSAPAESQPALPASSANFDFQAALTPVLSELVLIESAVKHPTPSFSFSLPKSSQVPLYVRTHSFLI